MSMLDDLFHGDDFGGLFDLDSNGSVDPVEAMLTGDLLLGHEDRSSVRPEPEAEFDEELLDAALEVGLDPDAYDTEEDLLADLREESSADEEF